MTVTIGLVANVYNEIHALPGWLETHLSYFDDVRVLHAGPQGVYSDDGTIELLQKWYIPIEFCAIDDGFGAVRTQALRMCPCDWVMLLDADERFYPVHRYLTCTGESTPHSEVDSILQSYDFRDGRQPDWDRIAQLGSKLRVDIGEPYDQGAYLRSLLSDHPTSPTPYDAVVVTRRHWHDFSFRRPTQNWLIDSDRQMRLLRNHPDICFDLGTRMHERVVGVKQTLFADMMRGPFFDHFHFSMKRLETAQRSHDVAIYDAINEGRTPPLCLREE